jgi:hypothetical protein
MHVPPRAHHRSCCTDGGWRRRFYSAYVAAHPDSQRDYQNNQAGSSRDRYDDYRLEPFYLPDEPAKKFLPEHCFDTVALGYTYDELPAKPRRNLRAPPTYAAFEGLNAAELGSSFTLFVLIHR